MSSKLQITKGNGNYYDKYVKYKKKYTKSNLPEQKGGAVRNRIYIMDEPTLNRFEQYITTKYYGYRFNPSKFNNVLDYERDFTGQIYEIYEPVVIVSRKDGKKTDTQNNATTIYVAWDKFTGLIKKTMKMIKDAVAKYMTLGVMVIGSLLVPWPMIIFMLAYIVMDVVYSLLSTFAFLIVDGGGKIIGCIKNEDAKENVDEEGEGIVTENDVKKAVWYDEIPLTRDNVNKIPNRIDTNLKKIWNFVGDICNKIMTNWEEFRDKKTDDIEEIKKEIKKIITTSKVMFKDFRPTIDQKRNTYEIIVPSEESSEEPYEMEYYTDSNILDDYYIPGLINAVTSIYDVIETKPQKLYMISLNISLFGVNSNYIRWAIAFDLKNNKYKKVDGLEDNTYDAHNQDVWTARHHKIIKDLKSISGDANNDNMPVVIDGFLTELNKNTIYDLNTVDVE